MPGTPWQCERRAKTKSVYLQLVRKKFGFESDGINAKVTDFYHLVPGTIWEIYLEQFQSFGIGGEHFATFLGDINDIFNPHAAGFSIIEARLHRDHVARF